MKLSNFFLLFSLGGFLAQGASASLSQSFEKDVDSIKKLSGCFEVTYQNAETFSAVKDYSYHDRYKTKAVEWVFVDEEQDKKISLQHILLIPGPMGAMKHWRQVWHFENESLFQFFPPLTWKSHTLSPEKVQGEWTQKVYQVDDSPRYECSAPWIHNGEKSYWECETDAPLPRREFSHRSDYDILQRNNRHEIKPFGHIHDEDNTKIITRNGTRVPLVMEKGLNVYKRVADEKCQSALTWWPRHKAFWKDAQQVWSDLYQTKTQMTFLPTVEGKPLWEKLFELDEKFSGGTDYQSGEVQAQVKAAISSFLEN